jgi:TonB family protein
MSVRALRFDLHSQDGEEVRDRTGWTMVASVVVHAALLAWLVMLPAPRAAGEMLTEITLLGPGEPEAAPAAAGAPAPPAAGPRTEGARHASDQDEHFRREAVHAAFAPDPQSDLVTADRVSARLATLASAVPAPAPSGAAEGAPMSLWSTPAGVPGATGGGGTAPRGLDRGEGLGHGRALELGRGGGGGTGTARAADVAVKALPAEPQAAAETESHARRSVAGASLAGPIADRPVLHVVTPGYPEWAKRDGVEATVTLYFVVRPDGSVREDVLVQKTAGFADFDDNARAALAAWRFEPLHGGRTGEQWGTITFRYRLRDA